MSRLAARTALLLALYFGAPVDFLTIPVWGEPVTTIRNNGDSANRVDMVIIGDGYTVGDLAKYSTDIETFIQGFFAQEPLKEYQRFFNVHRVDVVSNESGADHPERNPPVFRDTALDAAYNCASIQRLVCVNVSKVNEVLFRSLPADKRDIVLVIVNDTEYGGSGGAVAVASVHSDVVELILHELGHSFGLLADEYGGPPPPFCDSSIEPAEANATKQSVRQQIKWNHWINPATPIPTLGSQPAIPGLYPGAKYCDTGLFRPTFNSKMRSLNVPFEQINSEQLIKRIYNWVSPIDSIEPLSPAVTLKQGFSQIFRVHVPEPLTLALQITWKLDGQPIGNGVEFILSSSGLALGTHSVEVVVADPTSSVRSDPTGLLMESATWNVTVVVGAKQAADFDGEGKSDIGIYRTGTWFIIRSSNGVTTSTAWGGLTQDIPVPSDYDGDGKADVAVYRDGTWFIIRSSDGAQTATGWGGLAQDEPVPADYDGDGKTDIAVYRSGVWFIRRSTDTGMTLVSWGGAAEDVPVPADYDGDGKTDIAVFRDGVWFILRSSDGGGTLISWGTTGDVPVPGDYDGDGKTDAAVYRGGNWFVRRSSDGGLTYIAWGGAAQDKAVPADYDGDGKTDAAVYRNGVWFIRRSTDTGMTVVSWGGLVQDIPLN